MEIDNHAISNHLEHASIVVRAITKRRRYFEGFDVLGNKNHVVSHPLEVIAVVRRRRKSVISIERGL